MVTWFLKRDEILALSYGARTSYVAVLSASRKQLFLKDLKVFDFVPSSTYYRHRKEILDKTGLDLNNFFPTAKPVSRNRMSMF